jgi:hypothetical protein
MRFNYWFSRFRRNTNGLKKIVNGQMDRRCEVKFPAVFTLQQLLVIVRKQISHFWQRRVKKFHGAELFLESWQSLDQSRNCPPFMELEGSLKEILHCSVILCVRQCLLLLSLRIPGIDTLHICMYYMFRPTVAIIRYIDLLQSPFFLSTLPP